MADTLTLPAPVLERDRPVVVVWRPDVPELGELLLEWRDGNGRLLERHRRTLDEEWPEVAVPLDLRRARALGNRVDAWFRPSRGGPERQVSATFMARPAPGWSRYEVLYWPSLPPAVLARLPALGVTGTALRSGELVDGRQRQARTDAGLRWYGENLATDFYAAYHRWTPGRAVDWLFSRARTRHRAGEADAFRREPPLADPAWLATVEARLERLARTYAPERPLFLNLADEAGIADLAAAWDFDLSPSTLAAWRVWLREEWSTLDRLNAAFGTRYPSWNAVMPALTDDALRNDLVVPAWMAFKAGMDALFARAVRAGTEAVRRGDPQALAGLEGGQMPGWGGYDYGRLAHAVDLMEIYDIANAVAVAKGLNPGLRILTTSFGSGAAERHRLWHLWLKGADGVVVWDENESVVTPGGVPGARGTELAPLWRELGGALGALRLGMTPERGQVAALYSQESFRLRWLLDRRADVAAGRPHWTARDAEAENAGSAWHRALEQTEAMLAGLGAPLRWVTPDTLASRALEQEGVRALVLPHSIALGDGPLQAVRRFAAQGGLVLADTPPGEWDAMGRRRPSPPLTGLGQQLRYPAALRGAMDAADQRGVALAELAGWLAEAGAAPSARVTDAEGRTAPGLDLRWWRDRNLLLLGVQRTAGVEEQRELTLRLASPAWIRTLRGGRAQAFRDAVPLRVSSVVPELLLLSPMPLPGVAVHASEMAVQGTEIRLRLSLSGPTPGTAHPVEISVLGPDGNPAFLPTEIVRVPQAGVDWSCPLPLDAQVGRWQVSVLDVLHGQSVETAVNVTDAAAAPAR